MMTIGDRARYQRYREMRDATGGWGLQNLFLPMVLFGSIGAITWAIRGTNGWGGIDGTLLPGLTWGLLWHYLCVRKGIDARGIVLWLGLGIALGGELGYGQYVSWIRGMFNAGDEVIPTSPWVGYIWFVICGIGWGAPGGIVLGWALDSKVSVRAWLVRACFMLALLVILFDVPLPLLGGGAISRGGELIAQCCPGVLFPHADLGLYAEELDQHLSRTVYTNTQNFAVLIWWVAALCVAALQRDRATLVCGAVIGGGFGIGFAQSAVWCLGYTHAPAYIDWWKMWELNAGFNLGLLYLLTLYWATRRLDKTCAPDGTPVPNRDDRPEPAAIPETHITLFLAVSGFALVFAAGFEYFFWTGLLLSAFYAGALIICCWGSTEAAELRKRISLSYTAFLLVFMLLHGGTSRGGVFLGLYAAEAVDQYQWPAGRVALFAPCAAVVVVTTLVHMAKQRRVADTSRMQTARLPERMTDLLAFIGFIGALSIWPEKIGALYAMFLWFALFAFTRINRRFDECGI